MSMVRIAGIAVAVVFVAYSGKVALTRLAVAETGASYQLAPSGDVWVTADEPRSLLRRGVGQAVPANQGVPTGDVWPTGS